MTRTHNGWTSDGTGHNLETPPETPGDFDRRHEGKSIKTVIGVALLVVLALLLSRMHPVPHEISDPSATTGQTSGANTR